MTPRKKATPTEATVPEMTPAQEVDDTVKNQESLGSAEVVDRNPEPTIVQNSTNGAFYDVSKSAPEVVDPEADENESRQNRLRQTSGALNAKDFADENADEDKPSKISLEFLESGLSASGKVWRKGEVLELDDSEEARAPYKDTEGNVWYDLSANEQKEKYGKVFFEKR
jgi:hypothetical protein